MDRETLLRAMRGRAEQLGVSVYPVGGEFEIVKDSNGAILATMDNESQAIARAMSFARQYQESTP